MGSSHWLGPWSVIQAALQGGAAISRPTIPTRLSCARAGTATGIASSGTTSSAAGKYFIFIVRLLFTGASNELTLRPTKLVPAALEIGSSSTRAPLENKTGARKGD